MNHLCCIGITLAARIIAALGLSTSVLMTNVVVSEYFANDDKYKFFNAIETWSLLGINWTQFLKNVDMPQQVEIMLICFLGYSLTFLASSTLLALGTVYRTPKYAMPWLYLQMISIIDQIATLVIHILQPFQQGAEKAHWYTPVSSVILLITVYFWMVVLSAREDWLVRPRHYDDFIFYDPSEEAPRDSNVPKTPSFLAQNLTYDFREPHTPHIPPKYDVV